MSPIYLKETAQENEVLSESIKNTHAIAISRLRYPEQAMTKKVLAATIITVKILAFPLAFLAYVISKAVYRAGIGSSDQAKQIDQSKRKALESLGGEEIRFSNENSLVLEGMFFSTKKSAASQKTILLCTGSHQSYECYSVPMVKALLSMGHNVMTFNYEGFGNSQGSISEHGIYRSVEAAYAYLKQVKMCTESQIVGWGYSLGGGAVSHLAKMHPIDIVLDRSFSSMSQVASQVAPFGFQTIAKLLFVANAHFNNVSKLKRFQKKAFIAQGKYDDIMESQKHGKKLQKTLGKRADFYEGTFGHFHDENTWFSEGEPGRKEIEKFLENLK